MTDFDRIDIDKSGTISREEWELEMTRRRLEIEDEDNKRDQQRKMVWVALWGMLLYPLFVFGTGALLHVCWLGGICILRCRRVRQGQREEKGEGG
jgi:hypothetical protein